MKYCKDVTFLVEKIESLSNSNDFNKWFSENSDEMELFVNSLNNSTYSALYEEVNIIARKSNFNTSEKIKKTKEFLEYLILK